VKTRMKPKLYLETTIPSYLTAWPSRDLIVAAHQQITKEWWRSRQDAFEIYVSQFVLDEAAAGDADAARERLDVLNDLPLLDIMEAVSRLALALLQAGAIPAKAARDAAHIAVSAVHGIDYLMTWNCAHIANAMIIKKKSKRFACKMALLVLCFARPKR
jgi:predicted nucleic acid-binding protein